MRHEDAMGKEEGLITMGEWEKKGWLKKHRSQHVFDHPVRGHAFACYCEEQLQLLAAQHEWEVLGVRRCLHTVPGKGFAKTGPGAFGWLRVMPACFEQTELEFRFKMEVKAPVGWQKGIYQGTSVEGKVELVRIV